MYFDVAAADVAVENFDFVLSVDVKSFFDDDDRGRSSSGITVVDKSVVSIS